LIDEISPDRLHLHPVSATYKLRPHLGYIDVLSQKVRRKPTDEDDSDPEQQEEDDNNAKAKKGNKEAKEIHMHARKTDGNITSSMSDMRREMLRTFAAEESEDWVPIRYCDEVLCSIPIASFINLNVS
jgi:DNA-directed RNA polymerase III subunit RPC5